MCGLIFNKLKTGIWYAACFVIILLFCSLPMKKFFDNYIIALTALVMSLIIIPIYAYLKRRKNKWYLIAFRSVKYSDRDASIDKFKCSPLFVHFKAEAFAAAFYSLLLVSSFFYYLAKGRSLTEILVFGALCTLICFAAIMLLDYLVWIKTVSYYDNLKNNNQNKKLGR
jgi:hypothetical protein